MKILRIAAAFMFMAALLSACGGGGGSTASTPSSPSSPGEPPLQAPAVPRAVYTGTTQAADVETPLATEYAQVVFTALQFLQANAQGAWGTKIPAGVTERTVNGAGQGQVVLSGRIQADHSGWMEEVFSDYSTPATPFSPATVVDGTIILYQDKDLPNVNFSGTIGFDKYREKVNGGQYTLNGNLTYEESNSGFQYTGNVSIDFGTVQLSMSDLKVVGNIHNVGVITGRVYDSLRGYVDVATPVATAFGEQSASGNTSAGWNIFPGTPGGDVTLAGGSGGILHIGSLNNPFVWLGFDSDRDGQVDSGARLDRNTGELDNTPLTNAAVLAVAQIPATSGTQNTTVTVDGRFSYSPNAFVTYSWGLITAPPGSALQVSGTQPTLTFTPDVSGTYLIRLTVSAGGNSSTDVIPVYGAAGPLNGGSSRATQFKVANYISAHVGDTVRLDGRASAFFDAGSTLGNIWTLHSPGGSAAALSTSSALTTTFTPDKAGIYYAILGHDDTDPNPVDASAISIIAVDEPLRFAPPVALLSDNSFSSTMDIWKFSGAGDGFMLPVENRTTLVTSFTWYKPDSHGLFTATGSATPISGERLQPVVLTSDLNGDGTSDLVTALNCEVGTRESGTSSYSLTTYSLDSSCSHRGDAGLMTSGTIGGHPAIVRVDMAYGASDTPSFAAFTADSSGVLQSAVYTTIQSFVSSDVVDDLSLGDVDGDGEADLVVAVTQGTLTHTYGVQVYHGNGDGSFTYSTTLTPSGGGSDFHLLLDDFDGDSKIDIAITDNTTLNLFSGDGSGGFSASPTTFSMSCSARAARSEDLNHDGYSDIVLAVADCGHEPDGYARLGMLLTDSSGGLTQEQFYPVATGATGSSTLDALQWGDFNSDGFGDAFMSSSQRTFLMPQISP